MNATALLRAARPKQWAKNALVFMAPGAAGILFEWPVLLRAFAAFALFSAAASGTYLLNDVADIERDRLHPTKRNRPIAAGLIPVPVAVGAAVVLIVGAIVGGVALRWEMGVVLALYVGLTTAYSAVLKNQPVLDVVALSSGFIVRLVGGGVAESVPISDWFLIVSCFGSLFMATCKRLAEKRELGDDPGTIRPTLAVYSGAYLRFLEGVSASIVLIAYFLWAVDRVDTIGGAPWIQLSILPFLVAILRYALLVDLGQGSAPEEVVMGDGQLLAAGALWALTVGIGIYVA